MISGAEGEDGDEGKQDCGSDGELLAAGEKPGFESPEIFTGEVIGRGEGKVVVDGGGRGDFEATSTAIGGGVGGRWRRRRIGRGIVGKRVRGGLR